ncbi:hypothetical protein GOP47_0019793 [Adiantum capillus-veneris]|uniref:Uncharacterized protein n=1 Tax=Adiantum capillus-veneris TaxID=13818 RepID=A0A9D4UBQ6_ADICA|nr:hypothetical protein GOP47_0019793 [Adiantum capillus-veneris]
MRMCTRVIHGILHQASSAREWKMERRSLYCGAAGGLSSLYFCCNTKYTKRGNMTRNKMTNEGARWKQQGMVHPIFYGGRTNSAGEQYSWLTLRTGGVSNSDVPAADASQYIYDSGHNQQHHPPICVSAVPFSISPSLAT